MTFLGELGMFGLGMFLVTQLPKRATRANLVAAAVLTAGLTSLVTGLVFVLVAPHMSATLRNSSGTLVGAAIVIVGVTLTAATFVFDQASIGLLRGGLQLARNVAFAAGKLLVLPAAAFTLHDKVGTGITLSWVAGTAISVIPVTVWLWWNGSHIFAVPDFRALRNMGRTIAGYNWLHVAASAPTLLTPMVVTVVVSPSANGAFYAAWMLAGMLYIVPNHLSTVLVAVTANSQKALARRLRFTLMLSFLVGIPGMAALSLGGHLLLGIFGNGYVAQATRPLVLLTLAYIPMVLVTHYTAVCRAIDRVPRAATVSALAAVAELAAIVLGAKWDGLVGLAVAVVSVRGLTSLVVTPAVLRVAAGHGRHRLSLTVPPPEYTSPGPVTAASQTSQ